MYILLFYVSSLLILLCMWRIACTKSLYISVYKIMYTNMYTQNFENTPLRAVLKYAIICGVEENCLAPSTHESTVTQSNP
jgi:hypothetical protein